MQDRYSIKYEQQTYTHSPLLRDRSQVFQKYTNEEKIKCLKNQRPNLEIMPQQLKDIIQKKKNSQSPKQNNILQPHSQQQFQMNTLSTIESPKGNQSPKISNKEAFKLIQQQKETKSKSYLLRSIDIRKMKRESVFKAFGSLIYMGFVLFLLILLKKKIFSDESYEYLSNK